MQQALDVLYATKSCFFLLRFFDEKFYTYLFLIEYG